MSRSRLSLEDREHLAELDRRFQMVRDRVAAVAAGRSTCFALWGRGGIGKSWAIEDELRRRGVHFILTNSHVTGRGLVERLRAAPELVHLIEDVEAVARDPQVVAVLTSACWGTRRNRAGRFERWITWRAHRVAIEFPFTGGIVITSNLDLSEIPRLAPLKTRISCMELQATDREIAAKMREIALDGYPRDSNGLEPEECMEVVDFIIQEASRISRRLDLRLLVNSFEDRIQADDLDAGCSWRDLVASRVCDRPSIVEPIETAGTRARKRAEQLAVARDVAGLPKDDRLQTWQARTGGLSRATLYRRLEELANEDSFAVES